MIKRCRTGGGQVDFSTSGQVGFSTSGLPDNWTCGLVDKPTCRLAYKFAFRLLEQFPVEDGILVLWRWTRTYRRSCRTLQRDDAPGGGGVLGSGRSECGRPAQDRGDGARQQRVDCWRGASGRIVGKKVTRIRPMLAIG